jgi:hypothetical protein
VEDHNAQAAMAPSRKHPKPKKPGGKKLTRPNTRRNYTSFHSNTTEVGALLRELEKHLTDETQRGDTPEVTWKEWHSQTNQISQDLHNKWVNHPTALPLLRTIATNLQFDGTKPRGNSGTWRIYSQAVHESENAFNRAPSRDNTGTPIPPPTQPASPNLLASSEDGDSPEKQSQTKEPIVEQVTEIAPPRPIIRKFVET